MHAAAGIRQEVGNRLVTATESAGPQLFLKVAIALLPTARETTRTGKVISNKNRMKERVHTPASRQEAR